MKILICTNHFYPENFRVNDIAYKLLKDGHEVEVLTAIPDYPLGRYFDGYGLFKKRCECVDGIKVIRGAIIPRGRGKGLRIMLNYLSFTITSFFISLYLALFKKYDAVFVHETSPVMIGIPAVIVKKIQKIPMYFWVLDLWPESMQAAGGINNSLILKTFEKLTAWIYRNSDKILIASKAFKKSICDKGDFANKTVFFPNWPDVVPVSAVNNGSVSSLPELPEGFIVMFAGNIGEAQDFDHVLEAARILKNRSDIHFVFLGDGRKKLWVDQYVKDNALQETVHCLGRYPGSMMPAFYQKSSVMLLSLKDEQIFNLTIPAKLQGYMGEAKPVVAMLNGEGPRVIAEAQCGLSVPAGDSEGLANNIRKMAAMDKEELSKMGQNGRTYQQEHFTLEGNMARLYDILGIK